MEAIVNALYGLLLQIYINIKLLADLVNLKQKNGRIGDHFLSEDIQYSEALHNH
jgi:hypothetical protein